MHSIFHIPRSGNKGTTLTELLVVIAIIALIGVISLLNLFGRRGQVDLANTTQQIATLLREARVRSVSQSSSTSWGVHFGNTAEPFYALFYSNTYAPTTTIGYYRLPRTLAYDSSTISYGSSLEITFSQISGLASASTSLTLFSTKGNSSSTTIHVASSGAVSF